MADIVSGLRQVIQDLLVPELKAVQVELKNHTEQVSLLRQDMDKRFEAVDKRFEAMDKHFEAIDKRFMSVQEQIHELISVQKEILSKLDLDKRVTKLETVVERLEQFLKKAG